MKTKNDLKKLRNLRLRFVEDLIRGMFELMNYKNEIRDRVLIKTSALLGKSGVGNLFTITGRMDYAYCRRAANNT